MIIWTRKELVDDVEQWAQGSLMNNITQIRRMKILDIMQHIPEKYINEDDHSRQPARDQG